MGVTKISTRETVPARKSGYAIERNKYQVGFVRADSHSVLTEHDDRSDSPVVKTNSTARHNTTSVIETRGNHKIVNSGEQFWVEDLQGQRVAGPWRAAFIAYGWLKQLEQGAHGDAPGVSQTGGGNPFQKHSLPRIPPVKGMESPEHEKSEGEKEDEAHESLEAKASGLRK